MRAEKDAGRRVHVLRAGHLLRNNLRGRLASALSLGLAGKLVLIFFMVVAAAFGAALAGGHTLDAWSALAWLAVCIFTGLAGAWAYRLTVAPLAQMVLLANRLAAGDLTQTIRITRKDVVGDRKSTRLNSSHLVISYAVFCLKKKISMYSVMSVCIKESRSPHMHSASFCASTLLTPT